MKHQKLSLFILIAFMAMFAMKNSDRGIKKRPDYRRHNTENLDSLSARLVYQIDSLHAKDLEIGSIKTQTLWGNFRLIDNIISAQMPDAARYEMARVLHALSQDYPMDKIAEYGYESPQTYMNLYRQNPKNKMLCPEIYKQICTLAEQEKIYRVREMYYRTMAQLWSMTMKIDSAQAAKKRQLFQHAGLGQEFENDMRTMMARDIDIRKALAVLRANQLCHEY